VGCSSRTELVIGVATDLRAKMDIDVVKLVASRNDTPLVQTEWPLSDTAGTKYELPGSFGLYSGDGSAVEVQIAIKGYKGMNVVVSRDTTLTLVSGQTLFMRNALVSACVFGKGPVCNTNETCVDGVCQKRTVDATRLPKYSADLVTKTECTPPVQYIVSSTGDPMSSVGDTCGSDESCHEGVCWKGTTGGSMPIMNMDAAVTD
jgi:hypothetical protein